MSVVLEHSTIAAVAAFGEAEVRVSILGTPVSIVDMHAATRRVERWVREKQSRYVCLADVHSTMRARWDAAHRRALTHADLVLPDGMPLVWVARSHGVTSIGRVAGADFMNELCRHSPAHWRHYLLGGADGVPERLADVLTAQNPQLRICGTCSPPFRPLTAAEDEEMVARINAAKPDIVWVGLGCPKQELWMAQHVGRISGAVIIGVGAAFNFNAGITARAPLWMRERGLEWLHRLLTDPRRLWRRYLVIAPAFAALAALETITGGGRAPLNRVDLRKG
jgi:N-acetylglucosaminyldiphosphoundecaprenol N-acetyl-beta-D-mannosaminyltransferase